MSAANIPRRMFVTGIGTGVGKTVISAILAAALEADYWKPVQAGFDEGTDSQWVAGCLEGTPGTVYPEAFKLAMPASPHIAAREENLRIDADRLAAAAPATNRTLVIEGAGGLMVPLNERQFVSDLAKALDAPIVLVSRNTLGSINHSLLTAMACRQLGLSVLGWVFNDNYLHYEEEIAAWTGYPVLASVPYHPNPGKTFVQEQAALVREKIHRWPC